MKIWDKIKGFFSNRNTKYKSLAKTESTKADVVGANIEFANDSKFYSPQFDNLGSYTGTGIKPFDSPEQDADDL